VRKHLALIWHRLRGKFLCLFALTGLTAILWHVLPSQPRCTLPGNLATPALSPDGRVLITARWMGLSQPNRGPIQVWDTVSGREIAAFVRDGEEVGQPVVSTNFRFVAVAVGKGTLRILDWKEKSERTITVPAEWPGWGFHFSPKGDLLFVDAPGPEVMLFETASGKVLHTFKAGSWDYLLVDDVLIYPVKEGSRRHLSLWHVRESREVGRLENAAPPLHLSPDGRTLLTDLASEESKGRSEALWDLATGERKATINPAPVISDEPDWFAEPDWLVEKQRSFSRDGKWLATWADRRLAKTDTGAVEFWDVAAGERRGRIDAGSIREGEFSPDSKSFISCKDRKLLTLYAVPSGRILWQKPGYSNGRFSSDASSLAARDSAGRIVFLDAATGSTKSAFELPTNTRTCGWYDWEWIPWRGRFAVCGTSEEKNLLAEWLAGWWPGGQKPQPFLYAFDVNTGKELAGFGPRQFYFMDLPGHLLLSEDGRAMVTFHYGPNGQETCCWHLPVHRPYRLIFGIPLAVAICWIGLRRLKHSVPSPTAAPVAYSHPGGHSTLPS
jgi:WD40 repeat protein